MIENYTNYIIEEKMLLNNIKIIDGCLNFELNFNNNNFKENRVFKSFNQFIVNMISYVLSNGYVIKETNLKQIDDSFIKSIENSVNIISMSGYNYFTNEAISKLPKHIEICSISFTPKYNIVLKDISFFKNELYYNCSSEEEYEKILKDKKINVEKHKVVFYKKPNKLSIKLNPKYGNGYKMKFFEDFTTGEIFSYDFFNKKSLIL